MEKCPVEMPAPGTTITIKVGDTEPCSPARKARLEGYHWTYVRVELAADGWWAVIERDEPNSYDDVMNGSGTGLGTHKVTERVKVSD